MDRKARLMPNGIPRYVRIYDNGGKTFDRYTAVFTGNFKGRAPYRSYFRGMSENPFSPQGFGVWDDMPGFIDRPSYSHLGKKVKFESLPDPVKKSIVMDYTDLWEIK